LPGKPVHLTQRVGIGGGVVLLAYALQRGCAFDRDLRRICSDVAYNLRQVAADGLA